MLTSLFLWAIKNRHFVDWQKQMHNSLVRLIFGCYSFLMPYLHNSKLKTNFIILIHVIRNQYSSTDCGMVCGVCVCGMVPLYMYVVCAIQFDFTLTWQRKNALRRVWGKEKQNWCRSFQCQNLSGNFASLSLSFSFHRSHGVCDSLQNDNCVNHNKNIPHIRSDWHLYSDWIVRCRLLAVSIYKCCVLFCFELHFFHVFLRICVFVWFNSAIHHSF